MLGLPEGYPRKAPESSEECKWAIAFTQKGVEPLEPVTVTGLSLSIQDGVSCYRVGVQCSFCAHEWEIRISRTLAVLARFFCPNCLSQAQFSGDQVAGYVRNREAPIGNEMAQRIDQHLSRLMLKIGRYEDEDVPVLVRYLNQEFISIVTEILFKQRDHWK